MSRKTTLFDQHLSLGAVIVDFAGWQMPIHYGSQIKEHHCVRQKVGVFDVSHMLSIDITGKNAKEFLRKILANDVEKLPSGKGLYSCLLNATAGVMDDLIVYRLDEMHYRCVVNAGCRQKDLDWFLKQSVLFDDVSIMSREDLAMLAIQGPLAAQKIQNLFAPKEIDLIQSLKPFHIHKMNEWVISRTGYTGEDGFEIMLPHNEVISFWQRILSDGVSPIGLGARDTLRLEAGLNLYGHDMDESVTPDESNLGWTVDVKDSHREFVGKKALIEQRKGKSKQQLVGVILKERGVCRDGMTLYINNTPHDIGIGHLTSGGFSPTLERGIALARIPSGDFSQASVQIRGKRIEAKIIKLPFIKNGKTNFSV